MTVFHSSGTNSAVPASIVNKLYITCVGKGGNTGGGVYRFRFEHASMIVTSATELIVPVINGHKREKPGRYRIISHSSTSPDRIFLMAAKLVPPGHPLPDTKYSLSLVQYEMAVLSLVVEDTFADDVVFICDPQVGNDPEPGHDVNPLPG